MFKDEVVLVPEGKLAPKERIPETKSSPNSHDGRVVIDDLPVLGRIETGIAEVPEGFDDKKGESK